MSKSWKILSEEDIQYYVFIILSLIVLFLTVKVYSSNSSAFQRYFGRIHPLVVLIVLFISALILFSLLLQDGNFAIYRSGNYKGILIAVGWAVPFAAAMIFVDTKFPFPSNMNIPYPDSLFFYPAMGYVVELLFHVLPFSFIYLILGSVFKDSDQLRIVWVSLLIVALLEPIFQVLFATSQDTRGVLAYVGLHLFLINIVQLLLFRRYDFVTMYSFRFSYYLLWHVVWGHLRLSILF